MKKFTLRDRIRYQFDNTMSRGPAGLVLWLASISAMIVLVVALVITLAGNDPDRDFIEILWDVLNQTLTPNAVDPKAGSLDFLGGMFAMTLVSLLMVSIFIGILTNVIDHRIQDLRKGRSMVVEQNHTLILGWSPQVFTIISELVEANSNLKNQCIVILADKDKIEMEDEIRGKIPNPRTTRVVCRTGNPLDLTDLEIANPHAARSIIVLAPPVDDPDMYVIKTILALTNNPQRKPEPYHIVAEIREEKNMQTARLVGREEAQIVLMGDFISRITVQTCRQSGLSIVYTELLNFGGDEIYFKSERALVGKTFGSAILAYEKSAIIGLQTPTGTRLNPPMDTVIGANDQIIAISEDDDTVQLSGRTNFEIDLAMIQNAPPEPARPERALVLGWNRWGVNILRDLDCYVIPGSETLVVSRVADAVASAAPSKNHVVKFQTADTTDRRVLDALNVPSYDHVIVQSYADTLAAEQADAQTLITLLHLRDISERAGKKFSIVSQMLDERNCALAQVTRADDFVVGDQLTSLFLAQVSENKHLAAVFADLFDPNSSEIYLKPAGNYVRLGVPVNFYTVVQAARQSGHTAIGYRLKSQTHDPGKSFGVVVNPDKSHPVAFAEGDKIIVLASG